MQKDNIYKYNNGGAFVKILDIGESIICTSLVCQTIEQLNNLSEEEKLTKNSFEILFFEENFIKVQ